MDNEQTLEIVLIHLNSWNRIPSIRVNNPRTELQWHQGSHSVNCKVRPTAGSATAVAAAAPSVRSRAYPREIQKLFRFRYRKI